MKILYYLAAYVAGMTKIRCCKTEMWSYFVSVLCLQGCTIFVESKFLIDFSTTGSFFQQIKTNGESNPKNEETFIKQEFFSCDREASCHHVLKSSTKEKYHLSKEDSVSKKNDSFTSVLKRFKPPAGGFGSCSLTLLHRSKLCLNTNLPVTATTNRQ